MRIVYLNPIGDIGGAERSLLAWMRATRSAFPQAELILIAPAEGSLGTAAREIGVHVEIAPWPERVAGLGDSVLADSTKASGADGVIRLLGRGIAAGPAILKYIAALRKILLRLEPTIIHSNGIKNHLLLRMALPLHSPHVVWHLHDFLGRRRLVGHALGLASSNIAGAIAVSHAVAHDAQPVLPRAKIDVIYNTTDVDRFSPAPAACRQLDEWAGLRPADADTMRVVLVATYARWKGQDIFIDAASRVMKAANQPIRFYIVGGPIYQTRGSQFTQAELHDRSKSAGLEDVIGFIPFRPNPAEVYRSADIVVHCSTQPEPFGLTVIEAMASGRPVVVSTAGGAAELFTNGLDALGISPGDIQGLADAICRLVSDVNLREKLGCEARKQS